MKKIIIFLFLFFITFINLYSENKDSIDNKLKPSKSPTGAIWRSLVVPGWGQLYVESYWKAPIFFGGFATLTYLIIYNHNNFVDYAEKLDKLPKTATDYEITKLWREYYRDNRDMSAFYLVAVYILSAVDAYVGAHLFDFDIDENLSMSININSKNLIPMMCIQLKF